MRPYRIKPKREQCELNIYMQEYKIVVDKITSLSLKFSGGSYIIPISLVVGVLSISFDHLYLNLLSIILPLVLVLYMYNHVRYMALQFKLSGYARHLEEKINNLSNSLDPKGLSKSNECHCRSAKCTRCVTKHESKSKRTKRSERRNKYDMGPIIVVLLFFMFVALLPLSIMPMIYSFSTEIAPLDQYNTVVVLGNKSVNNVPSSDMRDRLECLISNMDSFTDATIIFSGGNGEASLMEEYMSNKGYDDNDYILETESRDTYENLQNIRKLVSGKTLIITSDYHAFRTDYISHKLNIDIDILSAHSTTPTILKVARECYAFLFEILSNRNQRISIA